MIKRKRLSAVKIETYTVDYTGMTENQIKLLKAYNKLNKEGRKEARKIILSILEEQSANSSPKQ